jgi:hypothetical protein
MPRACVARSRALHTTHHHHHHYRPTTTTATITTNTPPTHHQCGTQARRVRAGLCEGQPAAELRRLSPYGWVFYSDWLTRLDVLRGAAAGLEYMHRHGVVHR